MKPFQTITKNNLAIVFFSLIGALLVIALIWDWDELYAYGGLGLVRNNVGWVYICIIISCGFITSMVRKKVIRPQYWRLSLISIALSVTPFILTLKDSHATLLGDALLLPIGLVGVWLLLISLHQFSFIKNFALNGLYLIIIIAFIESFLGIKQFYDGSLRDILQGSSNYKMTLPRGSFNQPNLFASFIATSSLIILYLSTKIIKPVILIILSLSILINSFILGVTESRVGIYSLIVGSLLSLGFIIKTRNFNSVYILIIAISSLLLSQVFLKNFFPGKEKDFSNTQHRQVIYLTSLEAIKQKPLLGHGLGNYEYSYVNTLELLNQQKYFHNGSLQNRPQNITHPHNEFLYWGIQGGLLSILGLGMLLGLNILAFGIRNIQNFLLGTALIFPISLHLMVELPFYISTVHLMTFIFLIYFCQTAFGETITTSSKFSKPTLLLPVIIAPSGFVCLILLTNIQSLKQVYFFTTALNRSVDQIQKAKIQLNWTDLYLEKYHNYIGSKALKAQNLPAIEQYLTWTRQRNKIQPRIHHHLNQYTIYRKINDHYSAEKIKSKALMRYKGNTLVENELK